MESRTRRNFLAEVGKGMLTAGIGVTLAEEFGLASESPEKSGEIGAKRLNFGRLESLAAMLQENSADKALALSVERLQSGTSLRDLTAAAALANARAFGGEDYVGYHAFMALAPAYEMSKERSLRHAALPVLKVLYRSTNQIQSKGARASDTLTPLEDDSSSASANLPTENELRESYRAREMERAESQFHSISRQSAQKALDALQPLVQDDTDVHRVVLAYRAWDLLGLTGKEHAHTTLRQSVRYCVNAEKNRVAKGYPVSGIRTCLPKLMDQHHLLESAPGQRQAEDSWVKDLSETLLKSTPDGAAEAIAVAIREGFSLNVIGEALSLAATQQTLRDPGRIAAFPGKPIGSVHGDSPGVHASDSINAWRNMAQACRRDHAVAGLITAGFHLAVAQRLDWAKLPGYPFEEHLNAIKTKDSAALLRELDAAIRENHQSRSAAIVHQYGALGYVARPVFDLLLSYAVSEDGTLHAEKYYRTVAEEFGRTRKAFRWTHLTALARVTASEYGKRADGYDETLRLLKLA